MNRYPVVGETIEITRLDIHKDILNANDMIATVIRRNGDYIYVRTHKLGIELELYNTEMKEYCPCESTG